MLKLTHYVGVCLFKQRICVLFLRQKLLKLGRFLKQNDYFSYLSNGQAFSVSEM
jgi:hypothetical protein